MSYDTCRDSGGVYNQGKGLPVVLKHTWTWTLNPSLLCIAPWILSPTL